jgi:uncharacterized membrane protein YqjE
VSEAEPKAEGAGGFMQSLRRLAATLIEAVHTRLELAATEIEEERLRILQLLLWGALSLFFLALGLVMLTFFVVLVFWETDRVLVTFLIAAIYLIIGAVLAFQARARARQKSRLFAATLAELDKDRDRLLSR